MKRGCERVGKGWTKNEKRGKRRGEGYRVKGKKIKKSGGRGGKGRR